MTCRVDSNLYTGCNVSDHVKTPSVATDMLEAIQPVVTNLAIPYKQNLLQLLFAKVE